MDRSLASRSLVLLVDGCPVTTAEVAADRRARARGLLGRAGIDGALVLPQTASVHTIGMRFPIDVAWCTRDLEVLVVRTVATGRIPLPRLGARVVVEAEAGSFARWGIRAGARMALSRGWP